MLAYVRYSQKEANRKIWNYLMGKYELLKKKYCIWCCCCIQLDKLFSFNYLMISVRFSLKHLLKHPALINIK